MKIFNSYGSKERLFEMVERVNKTILTEAILSKEKKIEIINEFVNYAANELKLKDLPKIILSSDDKEAETMHSFGKYTPSDNEIRVVIVNRNLADILITLAHELTHHQQFKEGKLTKTSNDTGSPDENQANTIAGIILRNFGKSHPIIFE
jgi:hypothetical protein